MLGKDSPNLDLLRAAAVSFVLFDHTTKYLGRESIGPIDMNRLGGLGVSLFFVHTCLVLMLSMERQQGSFSGWRSICNFYVRRAFRIYPLCIMSVLAVVAFRIPSDHIGAGIVYYRQPGLPELFANLLLVQNLVYQGNVIGVLWSLPLEVQMYLLLPFLFLLIPRIRFPWAWIAIWLLTLMLALVQPSVTMRLNIAQYIPQFLPGVIAYVFSRRYQPTLSPLLWPLFLIVLIPCYLLGQEKIAGWFVCLLCGLAIPHFREISNLPVRVVSSFIAKYSYGVYLLHVPCLALAYQYHPDWSLGVRSLLFALLIVGLPIAVYHVLEQPLIVVGGRFAERWFGIRPRARDTQAVGA